jgi:hypothetical protein
MGHISAGFGKLTSYVKTHNLSSQEQAQKAKVGESPAKTSDANSSIVAPTAAGVGNVLDTGNGIVLNEPVNLPNPTHSSALKTVGYENVDGCEYKKDGTTYYLNSKTNKMETKGERIDSSLNMIESYLTDLQSKLPNNSYIQKLLDQVKNNRNELKNDVNVMDLKDVGLDGVSGFGGLGKITVDDDSFKNDNIASTARVMIHELVHYTDKDSETSMVEEMDATALDRGFAKSNGLSVNTQKSDVAEINDYYKMDLKQGPKHMLNDSTMDELRNHLGYGETVQCQLKEDKLSNVVSGSFINAGGNVMDKSINLGGSIGKKLGNEKVGRWVGGVFGAVPSVATGAAVGTAKGVGFVAGKVANGFSDASKSVSNAASDATSAVGNTAKKVWHKVF